MTAQSAIFIALGFMVVAYLIGSISPSILLAKSKGVDIKKEGSGNAGTTNTLRVLGPSAAVITLVIDVCKGFLAVFGGAYFSAFAGDFVMNQTTYLCAVGVVCGHIWPIFFKFKGGKGIATAFGALLAVNWMVALIALAIVALGVLVSRRMSVGSLLGALALPFLCIYFEFNFLMGSFFLAVLVIHTHRANLVRLRNGTEPKISFGNKGK
jgi:acyl phosphate:glycerol-3-phosphate acyltransferase